MQVKRGLQLNHLAGNAVHCDNKLGIGGLCNLQCWWKIRGYLCQFRRVKIAGVLSIADGCVYGINAGRDICSWQTKVRVERHRACARRGWLQGEDLNAV